MLNTEQYLKDTNKKQVAQFLLGSIQSGYTSGRPKVIVDGEDTQTSKTYTYLSSYTPVSGDRVLIAAISGTYVVLGKIL